MISEYSEKNSNSVIRFLGNPLILALGVLILGKVGFDLFCAINGHTLYAALAVIPEHYIPGCSGPMNLTMFVIFSVLPLMLAVAAILTFVSAKRAGSSAQTMSTAGLSLASAFCVARLVICCVFAAVTAYVSVTLSAVTDNNAYMLGLLASAGIVLYGFVNYFLLNNAVKGLRYDASTYGKPHRVSFIPSITMLVSMAVNVAVPFIYSVAVSSLNTSLTALIDKLNTLFSSDYLLFDLAKVNDIVDKAKVPSLVKDMIYEFVDNCVPTVDEYLGKVTTPVNELFDDISSFLTKDNTLMIVSGIISAVIIALSIALIFMARNAQNKAKTQTI
ncbi:MAG: hypothetical protein K5655_02235 [Lachnospiraceae bacterium]|nr:hypothetical protein [Lachnospiraceae bacterium]